jgi:hypothetical protein
VPGISSLPWLFEQEEIKSKPTNKIEKLNKCLFTVMEKNME